MRIITMPSIKHRFEKRVAAEDADAMETALQKAVPACQRIGTVAPYTGGKRILLR